jgi:hypothetical protein
MLIPATFGLKREFNRDVRAASGYLRLLTIGDLQGGSEGPVALYVKVGGYHDAFGRTVFPLERVGKRTVNL